MEEARLPASRSCGCRTHRAARPSPAPARRCGQHADLERHVERHVLGRHDAEIVADAAIAVQRAERSPRAGRDRRPRFRPGRSRRAPRTSCRSSAARPPARWMRRVALAASSAVVLGGDRPLAAARGRPAARAGWTSASGSGASAAARRQRIARHDGVRRSTSPSRNDQIADRVPARRCPPGRCRRDRSAWKRVTRRRQPAQLAVAEAQVRRGRHRPSPTTKWRSSRPLASRSSRGSQRQPPAAPGSSASPCSTSPSDGSALRTDPARRPPSRERRRPAAGCAKVSGRRVEGRGSGPAPMSTRRGCRHRRSRRTSREPPTGPSVLAARCGRDRPARRCRGRR